jgi:hypothetical protein
LLLDEVTLPIMWNASPAAIAWENYRVRSNRVFGFGSEGFYKDKGSPIPPKPAMNS